MALLDELKERTPYLKSEKGEMRERMRKLKLENDALKNGTMKSHDGDDLGRPVADLLGEGSGVQGLDYPVDLKDIRKMSQRSDILGSVLQTLRSELFKEGIEVEAKFDKMCPEGHEVEGDKSVCPEHNEILREPDKSELEDIDERMRNVNRNNQSLDEVLRQFEDDLNVFDNGYLFVLYRYWIHPSKSEIVKKQPKEVIRGDPLFTRIVANSFGIPGMDDEGNTLKFCPKHRENLIKEGKGENIEQCTQRDCHSPVFKAHYASSHSSSIGFSLGNIGGNDSIYYAEHEVIHRSKYEPSLTYGFPQTIKVMHKVMTMLEEDKFLKKNFGDEIPPRRSLIVKSDADSGSIMKTWQAMKEKAREFQADIVPFVTPTKDDDFEMLELMKPLEELQFIEHRREYRNVIASTFNVSPMFAGDGDSGVPFGKSSETQNLITEKAVRDGARIYNDKVLPKLSEKVFGLEDHCIVLQEPDVKSSEEERTHELHELQKARRALEVGLDVTWEDGEVNIGMPEDGELSLDTSGGMTPEPEGASGVPNREEADEDEITQEQVQQMLHKLKKKSNKSVEKRRQSKAEEVLDEHVDGLMTEVEDVVNETLPQIKQTDDFREARRQAQQLADNVQKTLREELQNSFNDAFDAQIQQVQDRHNWDLDERELSRTKNRLRTDFMRSQILEQAIKAIRTRMMEDISEEFGRSMKTRTDLSDLADKIGEESEDVLGSVKTIIRTEMHKATVTSNAEAYEQAEEEFDDEFKYKWAGPSDGRTTEVCDDIKDRIPDEGVSMEKLREIVNEEAEAHGFEEFAKTDDLTPHYNCRHQVLRTQ